MRVPAQTLAKLSRVCSFVPEHLRDPKSVRFVASLRGALRADLSTLEQFALADAITALQTAIKFPFREVRLEESSVEPLLRFAEVMVGGRAGRPRRASRGSSHCQYRSGTRPSPCPWRRTAASRRRA